MRTFFANLALSAAVIMFEMSLSRILRSFERRRKEGGGGGGGGLVQVRGSKGHTRETNDEAQSNDKGLQGGEHVELACIG